MIGTTSVHHVAAIGAQKSGVRECVMLSAHCSSAFLLFASLAFLALAAFFLPAFLLAALLLLPPLRPMLACQSEMNLASSVPFMVPSYYNLSLTASRY